MNKPTITPLPDGPFLVQGPIRLGNSKGPLESRPKMALCRCGASARKPLCDGAHAQVGFSGARQADRTEDRRVTYAGKKVTIHDNRGACSHAGFCTEGLPTAWRMGKEPWIDPDGGDPADIIRIVKQCPSGALSCSTGAEHHQDGEREPRIEVSTNGPYVVTGAPVLDGAEVCEGGSTEHYTLCRCGASKNKPFCDGSHWRIEFRDDAN